LNHEVEIGLKNYALSAGGDLSRENPGLHYDSFCIFEQTGGNTTIHDGDLWMYTLYVNGEVVDQDRQLVDFMQIKI
jgi:hypothetical protein